MLRSVLLRRPPLSSVIVVLFSTVDNCAKGPLSSLASSKSDHNHGRFGRFDWFVCILYIFQPSMPSSGHMKPFPNSFDAHQSCSSLARQSPLVLSDLSAPAVVPLLALFNLLRRIFGWRLSVSKTYYLLGKKRPGSGKLFRCSLSALTLNATKQMPAMAPSMTAVFAFQFLGCEYQPPAGDQMCFG